MASAVHSKINPSIPVHPIDDLQLAIDRDQTDETIKIMQKGDLANTFLPNGFLPLNYSIRLNKFELVKGILKSIKVDLSVKDDQGLTPIDHALITNNSEMISLLLGHKIGATFDASASKALSHPQLIYINQTIAEVQKVRSGILFTQLPPLHAAAREGNLSQVQALLNPKDPNAYDSFGITPLQHAVLAGKKEVVEWLLSKGGAKADILTQSGRSLVHLATIGGFPDLIPLLVETHKLNANLTDANGKRPLHYAVGFEDLSTARKLIENGANPLFPSLIDLRVGSHSVFSPLDMLLATSKERSRQRDPLELSSWDYLGCCAVLLPWALDSQTQFEKIAFSNLFDISTFFIGLNQFESAKSTLTFLTSYLATGIGYLSHQVGASPTLAFTTNINRDGDTMPRWILGMHSGLQTVTCYQVGRRALKGVAACWKNRAVEFYRPLRNLLVHTLIGVNTVAVTAASISKNYQENLFLNAWDECMKTHRNSFQSQWWKPTWVKDFTSHYKANGNAYNSRTFSPGSSGSGGFGSGSGGFGSGSRPSGSSGSGGFGGFGGFGGGSRPSGSGGSGGFGGFGGGSRPSGAGSSHGSGGSSGGYGGGSRSGGAGGSSGSKKPTGFKPPNPFRSSPGTSLSTDPEKNRILQAAVITKTDCEVKYDPYCKVDGSLVHKNDVKTQAATVLGLSTGFSEQDSKKAYRKLQLKYHPDKCTDCTEEEKNSLSTIVSASYDILSVIK